MLKNMKLSTVIDELFRIMPAQAAGPVDIALEMEIWERELADLPLKMLEETSRAFMRGDLGAGKRWRPSLPEFRKAANDKLPQSRAFPLFPPEQTRVISPEERQRIADGFVELREGRGGVAADTPQTLEELARECLR